MSKLIAINESHSFSVCDAVQYGVEGAVMLNSFRYWLRKNYADNRNIKNGYVWTYHTAHKLHKAFPYWSERKCMRVMQKLKIAGAIIVESLHENRWNQEYWYTLPDFKIDSFSPKIDDSEIKIDPDNGSTKTQPVLGQSDSKSDVSDCFSPITIFDVSNNQNCPIDEPNLVHVKDLTTDLTTDLKTSRSILQLDHNESFLIEEAFDKIFWPVWEGKKIARGECLKLFRSLIESKKICAHEFASMLVKDIQHRICTKQYGFDKIHPKSYLKGRRWLDQAGENSDRKNNDIAQHDDHSYQRKKIKSKIHNLHSEIASERAYQSRLIPSQLHYNALFEASTKKIALYEAKMTQLKQSLERVGTTS